jgi:hypothetical protein
MTATVTETDVEVRDYLVPLRPKERAKRYRDRKRAQALLTKSSSPQTKKLELRPYCSVCHMRVTFNDSIVVGKTTHDGCKPRPVTVQQQHEWVVVPLRSRTTLKPLVGLVSVNFEPLKGADPLIEWEHLKDERDHERLECLYDFKAYMKPKKGSFLSEAQRRDGFTLRITGIGYSCDVGKEPRREAWPSVLGQVNPPLPALIEEIAASIVRDFDAEDKRRYEGTC